MITKKLKKLILFTAILTGTFCFTNENVYAEWIHQDSSWKYTEEGVNITGWKLINGLWYYFYPNNNMAVGWVNDNGTYYYMDESGAMNTGWIKINDKWYYLLGNGSMATGWINDNNASYYLNSSGDMAVGVINIGKMQYEFDESGRLIKSSSKEESSSQIIDSDKDYAYDYINKNGYVATSENPLNVRENADIGSNIVDKLPKNSMVYVLYSKNNFYKVQYNNTKEGFVSKDYITFDKENIVTDDNFSKNTISYEENSYTFNFNIRKTAPYKDNKNYYSNNNIFYQVKLSPPFMNGSKQIIGNCTWYAYGRAMEITGMKQLDAGFTGNAYEWWKANLKSGKYKYGQTPRLGAIAVWNTSLPGSTGHGHVAVVEDIDGDDVYISESAWSGVLFSYKHIYNTEDLFGYIYLDQPNF
ncbi:CHAP domain-containing protein [Clostridium sp. BJN0001]|uniref:CHAP domain-containing protein n=1 Tax=Clostridium sp. BJN0001 TaxID=2930219 RepID=UPI001FD562AE|nr:CHAP domain-containing protein [Clostridium sp. BJN0001]